MLSRPNCVRLLCGVSLLFAAGCYRPGMYGPYRGYGPQNYPAVPYGQPQYLPQAQPYPGALTVPGGVVVPDAGGTYAPGIDPGYGTSIDSGYGTPIDSGLGTSIDSTGSDEGWRSFDSGFSSGGELGPLDGDLGNGGAGYGIDNGGGVVPQPQDDGMFRQDSARAPEVSVQASAYRQPEKRVPITTTSTYGYSGRDYTWLRGIVGFDQRDQMHNIIYSLKPDNTDIYGGNLTLKRDARLAQFRPGDIVEVRGHVDSGGALDAQHKPLYIVDSVTQVAAPR